MGRRRSSLNLYINIIPKDLIKIKLFDNLA
jgi:hypothetical protein